MYINRTITTKILQAAKEYPIISIFGPRQSGKTTLAKKIFDQHQYVSLENIDNREFAQNDPRGFIAQHKNKIGMILDEVQNVPDLLYAAIVPLTKPICIILPLLLVSTCVMALLCCFRKFKSYE